MKKINIVLATASLAGLLGSSFAYGAAISDYPLYLMTSAPPAVLLNLSVESPMGSPAYPTPGFRYYDPATEYVGLFDPQRCYTYNSSGAGGKDASGNAMNGRFEPGNLATGTYKHVCSGAWSGNFLNWLGMRAIDTFTWIMTGGNRVVDTTTETVLRVHRDGRWKGMQSVRVGTADAGSGDNYPRAISSTNLAGATPHGGATSFDFAKWGDTANSLSDCPTASTYNGKDLMSTGDGSFICKNRWPYSFVVKGIDPEKTYYLQVQVCASGKTESQTTCSSYTDNAANTYLKPIGLIQKNAEAMRFGITSYTRDCNIERDGGVLRSKMKYVGPRKWDPTTKAWISDQSAQEWAAGSKANAGIFISNPDGASGSLNSGVVNFINQFSQYGYKEYDPASELFYESLNYFRGPKTPVGPTSEYSGADTSNGRSLTAIGRTSSDLRNGGFWFYNQASEWDDPISYSCQKNFIIAINDPYTHRDKRLPGTSFTTKASADNENDYGPPSRSDSLNVSTWTNSVGSQQGLGASLATQHPGGNKNSYYIAGLAYWANTNDIRDEVGDWQGKQTVDTFMIDTQEPQDNPLVGQTNQLWLTGKYGGFTDKNNNSKPDLKEEWDANNDGVPDNYVLASDPLKLKNGLIQAFDNITSRSDTNGSSSSAVAANSTRLDTGSVIYQMKFYANETDGYWVGRAIAETLKKDGTINTILWDTWGLDGTKGRYTASEASSRKIFTWNPDTNKGAKFECNATWMNPTKTTIPDNSDCWLTNPQRTALREPSLPTGASWDDLLKYLRGDPTNETDTEGRFRYRVKTLGDIINSDPLYVGDENLGYDVLPDADGGGSTYATYRYSTETRTKMLYVGANDGMLHAFEAAPSGTTGVEVFTYVPNEVIKDSVDTERMKTLANLNYSHKYFVDGSPNFSDVYTGSAWKTYLVSSQGAGGRAVFALDITADSSGAIDMASGATTAGVPKVRWEFGPKSDTNTGSGSTTATKSPEIGYVLSQPMIARLPNKRWAAFFGNGPGSSSGKAKLFAIYLDANITDTNKWELGKDYLVFDTDNTLDNALGGVSVIGDAYQTATTVYAGDLKGRMWKFDVSSITTTDINCSSGCGSGTILFTTQSSQPRPIQPITAAPAIGAHSKCGVMVYFGTGKYYETGDQQNTDLQTLYGIWDQPGGAAISAGTTDLYEYQIDKQGTATSGTEWRVIADNNATKIPDLYAPSGGANKDVCKNNPDTPKKRGWFIDLKVKNATANTGERVTTYALLRHGRVIFTTIEPSQDFCSTGGKSWVMEIAAESGAPLTYGVFDINKDNIISKDVGSQDSNGICGDCVTNSAGVSSLAAGVSTGDMGIIKTPTVLTAGGLEYKIGSGSAKGELVVIKEKGTGTPRASWRQLQ